MLLPFYPLRERIVNRTAFPSQAIIILGYTGQLEGEVAAMVQEAEVRNLKNRRFVEDDTRLRAPFECCWHEHFLALRHGLSPRVNRPRKYPAPSFTRLLRPWYQEMGTKHLCFSLWRNVQLLGHLNKILEE